MSKIPEWAKELSPGRRREYDRIVRQHRKDVQAFRASDEAWDRTEYHRRYVWARAHFPGEQITRPLMERAPDRKLRPHARVVVDQFLGLGQTEYVRRYQAIRGRLDGLEGEGLRQERARLIRSYKDPAPSARKPVVEYHDESSGPRYAMGATD